MSSINTRIFVRLSDAHSMAGIAAPSVAPARAPTVQK